MPRRLPSPEETLRILATKRTRPVRRAAPTAGQRLGKLMRDLDARFGQGPDALAARWREIVGESLATRTEPVRLSRQRGGAGAVLELKVAGPAATLIQHQAPEILQRVNLFLGAGAVERLRIVQGALRRGAAGPKSTGAPRRRSAAPLDAGLEAELEAGLARAAEGPLKSALRRLGREVLRDQS
jgi:hypothetical protein